MKQLVEAAPDPQRDDVVRWRCVDLKRVAGQRFGVDLSEVSLGRVLKKLGFSHIGARPCHPVQDPQSIATFKKDFPARVSEVVSRLAPGTSIEVWFQDEMRVGQKNSLVYQWARKGSRPRQPKDQRYENAYIFGPVCPGRDGRMFCSSSTKPDGTSTRKLKPPGNVTLIPLPPGCPELNAAENVWQHLRQSYLPSVCRLHRHSRRLPGRLAKTPGRTRTHHIHRP